MSYPTGGRADKLGNRYEGRWVVKQFLQLISERISSIKVEPFGDEEMGVDLRIRNLDGTVIAMQCKGRNGAASNWTISGLKEKRILEYAYHQIEQTDADKFVFVSACPVLQLNDLTEFIRNLDSADPQNQQDAVQSRGQDTRKAFKDSCAAYNLFHDKNDSVYEPLMIKNAARFFQTLSNISSIYYPDDFQSKKDLIDGIASIFYGDAESIYSLFADYVVEQDRMDHWIDTTEICGFLELHGYQRRDFHDTSSIYNRINDMNRLFKESFHPISNKVQTYMDIHPILHAILEGKSVVVHGNSGIGKTGVLVRLLSELESIGICSLAVDIHHFKPNTSSTVKYGEQLGFTSSIEFCIDKITKDSRGVIIIDQLDSIRWTNSGFQSAQDVITLLLHRVSQMNQARKYPISIVFACRTFDLENDPNIKKMVERTRNDESTGLRPLIWERYEVLPAPEAFVISVIGDAIKSMQPKQVQVLRNPRSLYIWTQLSNAGASFSSFYDLQLKWWEQIRDTRRPQEISSDDVKNAVDVLTREFIQNGTKATRLRILHISAEAAKYLCSAGIFTYFENDQIGFSHQSVLDFFYTQQIISAIRFSVPLDQIIPPKTKQTPLFRYQMQTVLEVLLSDDVNAFSRTARYLMSSDARFFIKQLVFFVVGSSDVSDARVLNFILEYEAYSQYTSCILQAFRGNLERVEFLIQSGKLIIWISDGDLWKNVVSNLLISVGNETSSAIDGFLDLIYREKLHDAFRVYYMLGESISESDERFNLRCKILLENKFSRYIHWDKLIKNNPGYVILLLEVLNIKADKDEKISFDENEIARLEILAREMPEIVLDRLWKHNKKLRGVKRDGIYLQNWILYPKEIGLEYHFELNYVICKMLYSAAGAYATNASFDQITEICAPYKKSKSYVDRCIVLRLLECCSCHQYAIEYILSAPELWMVDPVGHFNHFESAREIINKHSPHIELELFQQLENAVYYFHDKDEIERLKYRVRNNIGVRKKLSTHGWMIWPIWGALQFSILPALDPNRMSSKSKELVEVLRRSDKVRPLNIHFNGIGIASSGGRSVVSPIDQKIGTLSDSAWMNIMINPKVAQSDRPHRWNFDDDCEYYYESGIREFASSFATAVRKDPNRFVKLVLKNVDTIPTEFSQAILSTIADIEVSNIGDDLVEQLILAHIDTDVPDCIRSICRIIRHRGEFAWDNVILQQLISYTSERYSSAQYCAVITSSKDPDGITYESLELRMINSVRGTAAEAIATLLFYQPNLFAQVSKCIEQLVYSTDDAARCGAVNIVLSLFSNNEPTAQDTLWALLEQDERLLLSLTRGRMDPSILWENNPDKMKDLLRRALNSSDPILSSSAASFFAYLYIKQGELKMEVKECILNSVKHAEAIMSTTASLMQSKINRPKCREIMLDILARPNIDAGNFHIPFTRIFEQLNEVEEEDIAWITAFSESSLLSDAAEEFYDFLQNIDIIGLTDMVFRCVNTIITEKKNPSPGSEIWKIDIVFDHTAKLVALLYKQSLGIRDQSLEEKCLDAWDELFILGSNSIEKITEELCDVI